jgi:LysM repeat protein
MKLIQNLMKGFRSSGDAESSSTNPGILRGNVDMEQDTGGKEQTGGLRLMMVFIVVLALHVFVIGGISVYHLFKGEDKGVILNQGPNTPASTELSTATASVPLVDDQSPNLNSTANAPSPIAPPLNDLATDPLMVRNEATEVGRLEIPALEKPANGVPALSPMETTDSQTIIDNTPSNTAQLRDSSPDPTAAVTTKKATSSYIIKAGDSLTKIARKHALTVAELKNLNGLKSDMIKVGQSLQVPGSGSSVASAGVPSSNGKVVKATLPNSTNKPMNSSYTIKAGDTLGKIARKFNTTPAAILAANRINDANKLKIGEVLNIPTKNKQTAEGPTQPMFRQATATTPDLVMNR